MGGRFRRGRGCYLSSFPAENLKRFIGDRYEWAFSEGSGVIPYP